MVENAKTQEDNIEEVHLPPNPAGKAKYPSQIKSSSRYRTVCTEPLLGNPFLGSKPIQRYGVISQIQAT